MYLPAADALASAVQLLTAENLDPKQLPLTSFLVCDVPVTSFNMDAWEQPTSFLLRLTLVQHNTVLSAKTVIFAPQPNSLIVMVSSASRVLIHLCIYNNSPEE